jgi:hypothetical protein
MSMSEKSYVTMEQALCPVCGKTHDTGALLLDRRLRPTFERNTVTGWALCADDKAKIDAGYIPLVGIDEAKSQKMHNGNIHPDGAYRTGKIAYLRREAWERIIDVPAPNEFCFVEDGVIDKLLSMTTEGRA